MDDICFILIEKNENYFVLSVQEMPCPLYSYHKSANIVGAWVVAYNKKKKIVFGDLLWLQCMEAEGEFNLCIVFWFACYDLHK